MTEVGRTGQHQVRNIWKIVAVYHLNLRIHTLLELSAWGKNQKKLCDRTDSPWDDVTRRPSHENRGKDLRQWILNHELSTMEA